MFGRLKYFMLFICISQFGCASPVVFDKKGHEFWPGHIFEIFGKYRVQLSVPPDGWEGDHTRKEISKKEARDNNILISVFYDFRPGLRDMPRTELFFGIARRDDEFNKKNSNRIGRYAWSITEFNHTNSGIIYETDLNEDYTLYITLSMSPEDFKDKSFVEPRKETLLLVVESLSISSIAH